MVLELEKDVDAINLDVIYASKCKVNSSGRCDCKKRGAFFLSGCGCKFWCAKGVINMAGPQDYTAKTTTTSISGASSTKSRIETVS